MYRSTQWLNVQLASRKLCPVWPRVPVALVIGALVVIALALTVALGGIAVHHTVVASGIAWGRL